MIEINWDRGKGLQVLSINGDGINNRFLKILALLLYIPSLIMWGFTLLISGVNSIFIYPLWLLDKKIEETNHPIDEGGPE